MTLQSNEPYERVSKPMDSIWNGLVAGAIIGGGAGFQNRVPAALGGALIGAIADKSQRASNTSKTEGALTGGLIGGALGAASGAYISSGARGRGALINGIGGAVIGGIGGAVIQANGKHYNPQ